MFAVLPLAAAAIIAVSSCSNVDDLVGGKAECNGVSFNDKTHFCYANQIWPLCSNKEYDPDAQYCDFGTGRVVDKDPNNPTTPPSNSNGGGGNSSSGSNNNGGGSGNFCYYSPGECWPMPTDDNCAGGALVNNCSNPGIPTQYCDWGPCVDGSGWECKGGGGCYFINGNNVTASGCTTGGGSIVSSCPAASLPPTAATSSSSSGGSITDNSGPCKDSQGRDLFCEYGAWQDDPGGCYQIDSRFFEPVGSTCEQLTSICQRDSGKLYVGVTGLTEANNWGKGLKCTNLGGTAQ
jgi:hypothetical protein